MGIVIITFIIIPATDAGLAFTMGQPCPGFSTDNPTDFFMRWALARPPLYREEMEAWSD